MMKNIRVTRDLHYLGAPILRIELFQESLSSPENLTNRYQCPQEGAYICNMKITVVAVVAVVDDDNNDDIAASSFSEWLQI